MALRGNRLGAALGLAAMALLAGAPAQAQFGGMLGGLVKPKPTASPTTTTSEGCPQGKKKSKGSAIMGSVIGSVAGGMASRVGIASWVPLPEVASALTNAIACMLDPQEQKQAAEATLAATRGDEKSGEVAVGTTTEWTSKSREGVKGRSTVVAQNDDLGKGMPQGSKCITVSDVIIVNGEETTANKRMCRAPGAARYALMA